MESEHQHSSLKKYNESKLKDHSLFLKMLILV